MDNEHDETSGKKSSSLLLGVEAIRRARSRDDLMTSDSSGGGGDESDGSNDSSDTGDTNDSSDS